MRTIRARLAASYVVALVATMFLFAIVLYLVQRGENLSELDARVRLESDLIAATLSEAFRSRGTLVEENPRTGRATLREDVATFLEGVPGYVLVVSADGDALHMSPEVRALPSYGSMVRLLTPALTAGTVSRWGSLDLGPPVGEVRYYVRPITQAGPEIAAVLSGDATASLVVGARRLVLVILLVAPLILAASVVIGYLLAGRALAPVDRVVDEVQAITDGRSLHRRLANLESGDELARLTATLNAMLERLERSFSSLRRFTADASHELKTPLTVLRAGIERALTNRRITPEVMEVLDETLVEVNQMTDILESLLTLARADEGRAPLALEPVDLRDLLNEIAETGGILGEQADVTVRVSIPRAPVVLPGDRVRLRQLFMNLLTNAIKFTPPGGRVDIRAEPDRTGVAISVRDTGIGIAPGDLPHIFDRFWRADAARSRTSERAGVGLGLAISKWIAEAHGGTINVQSRSGRGTTFTVQLPLSADEGSVAEMSGP
jgi:two-component system OmpR family sensor kinase